MTLKERLHRHACLYAARLLRESGEHNTENAAVLLEQMSDDVRGDNRGNPNRAIAGEIG